MDKRMKEYEMAFNVFEKQNSKWKGDKLTKKELKWKEKYNSARTESVKKVDGVKVTRYMPNWCESDNW